MMNKHVNKSEVSLVILTHGFYPLTIRSKSEIINHKNYLKRSLTSDLTKINRFSGTNSAYINDVISC